MRTETITKTILKFSELNADQKKKVIEKNIDINTDHQDCLECEVESFTEKLTKLGFFNIKVQYSGFCSQGDGASFTADHETIGKVYRLHSHYSHANTIYCDNEKTQALARDLSNEFYRDLEKQWDYLQSDAAIIETLECNDYEFYSDTLTIV